MYMLSNALSVENYLKRISSSENISLIVASIKRISHVTSAAKYTGKNVDNQQWGTITALVRCTYHKSVYRYKSSLIHHLKTVHHVFHHAYEKFYTCMQCKKLYVRFRAFQRHLLLHNEVKVSVQ